ncbi:hypothetical protein GZL_03525 [Streptomyces sp. 769]|nr:hypothetical protein GZL_03525 [Streptomyces sp. 769]
MDRRSWEGKCWWWCGGCRAVPAVPLPVRGAAAGRARHGGPPTVPAKGPTLGPVVKLPPASRRLARTPPRLKGAGGPPCCVVGLIPVRPVPG